MPTEKVVDFIAVDEIQLCNDFERDTYLQKNSFMQEVILKHYFLGQKQWNLY